MCALLLCLPFGARSEQALIAVATNFAPAFEVLVSAFEATGGHRIIMVGGSTGKLYAQIMRGAPFHAFLAADQERPQRLLESGRAVAGSGFTYAHGRLMLWSRDAGAIDGDLAETLRFASFRHLAIANPRTAPYGVAAREVLVTLGLMERLESRLVVGENIGQAFAFVATGSAEFGLVARSGVLGQAVHGSRMEVPAHLHGAIRQDAVLLQRGRTNPAAHAILAYLQGPEARSTILAMGYELPILPNASPHS